MSAPILSLMADPKRSVLIKQGAEAKVYISTLFPAPILTTISSPHAATSTSTKPASTLLKYRFPKTYRHQTLSTQLTSSRTTAEARALVRCAKAGVSTPGIVCVDDVQGVLGLELIQGKSIRELLGGGSEGDEIDEAPSQDEQEIELSELKEEDAIVLMRLIGEQIAKMHLAHVIHGDLTTSNMMARRKQNGEMEIVSRFEEACEISAHLRLIGDDRFWA
jgi:TP53 regulating kinase-like protein